MHLQSRVRRTTMVIAAIITNLQVASAQAPQSDSSRIDRLVALAKLWAAVTYFHPYLADRTDIDWDGALVSAIPKVDSAQDRAQYSAAIADMLAVIRDPVTRVLNGAPPAPQYSAAPSGRQPTVRRTANGILVVAMTNYAELQDVDSTLVRLAALKKQLPTARAVIFDLRPSVPPSKDETEMVSYEISLIGLGGWFTTTALDVPAERRRMHVGYVSDSPGEGYSSGFYEEHRLPIVPGNGARDIPVVFIVGPGADLPDMALASQAAGRAAIVAEGSSDEDASVSTQTVNLPDSVQSQIRLGDLVYENGARGYRPTLTVPLSGRTGEQNPAFRAALRLATTVSFPSPSHAPRAERARTRRDRTDDAVPYPSAPYRVLAAFRIWAVINYFFPYKDLMGEDWDETLRQFIPRMERATNALEYHLAVAEMVTHIHDSHGAVVSPVLQKYFGEASAPIRIRMIDDVPVITGFTNADAATAAGFEIGDVIVKVDGEDASRRIAERLRYLAHSTPQAGMFYATERSLVRGPKDSVATYTIRDVHDRVRDVTVERKVEYALRTMGDRSSDILRILPGNIGYADLDRLPQARVDEMFEKFKDCPGIIFDDRGYPQGTAWQIAPRLTDKTDVAAAMFRLRESMSPDLPNGEILSSQVVKTFVQRLPATDKWRYHGRTVLLIDERSVSQAEHSGLFFEAANGTKFIGSPTQGADGDVTSFSVPGGISVHFSGQGVWHVDGRQLQRVGLQPDVLARPTLAGIRAGRDEVLEKAIEYLGPRPQ